MKLLSLFLLVFSTSVFADDGYPLTGIDGSFHTVSSRGFIELKDIDGNPIVLSNDIMMRVRLSTQSNTIHFMKGNGHKQDIKIPNGFPNNDLRNFYLSGTSIGQDYDIEGRTEDRLIGRYSRTESVSCQYYCGRDQRGYIRYCYGFQPVRSNYDVYQRDFMMNFRDTTKSPIQLDSAQFNGVVKQYDVLIGQYPIGYCR